MKTYTYRNTTYACYRGFMTQAITNNLAPLLFVILRTSFGISYEQLGFLVLANFTTQLLTDVWATRYADKVGYRICMVLAHAFCTLGLLSLGILPFLLPNPYIGMILSVMLYAFGGGLLEVIVSPIVEALPSENKAGSMSLLHSFYCWGQMIVVIISTLFIYVIGRSYWFVLPVLWSLFPLYNLFQFLHVPLLPLVKEGRNMKCRELFTSPVFYISMLCMVCAGASELTMSQWSSMFAEKGLGLPKLYGDLLGPALFAVFMALARTLFGNHGKRIPIKYCLIGSSILCVITYSVTIFSPYPLLALFSCSLTGLAISLMWPGTYSMTSAAYPRGGTFMFGVLAICGDLGCSAGPWLAGKVSDNVVNNQVNLFSWADKGLDMEQIGLRGGLLAGIIFPALMLFGLLLYKKKHTVKQLT